MAPDQQNYPHVETVRISDPEKEILDELKDRMGCSKAEVFRRALWMIRVLFDPNTSFSTILRPMDEIAEAVAAVVEEKQQAVSSLVDAAIGGEPETKEE